MKSFKKHLNEAKDTHCSDKCCGADTKAEDCDCPPDCAHCNCNSVNEKAGTEYTPHWMYDPKTGNRFKAEKEVDHHRMKAMGYTHDPYKRESLEPDLDEALTKWAGADKRQSYYTSVKHAYRPQHRNTSENSYDPKKVENQAHLQHAHNFHDRETDKGYDRYHTTHLTVPHHKAQIGHLHKAMRANAKGDKAALKKHMQDYHHGNENHKINKTGTYPHAHHLPHHGESKDVKESFDPKHPKVMAARKAVKNGTYNGNVDKNGNAIVHIKGKPHTVTKGDPATRNESTNQLDELSPATLKSYKKKAVKQYKQSANKRNPGGGDYGSATKAAQDKHQKRFDKRHKGIGSEIKRTTDSDIHLKDPKGLVRRDPKANSLTGKPAPYKHRAESYLDEDTINSVTAAYINEHNITLDELENMTEAELNELIGKAIGGAFKLGAKAVVGGARLAGGAGKLAGKGIKKAVYNKQGNRRGSAAAKQDTKGDNAEAKAKKAERERAQRDRIANMEKRQAAAEKDLRDKDKAIRDKKQKLNDKK